MVGCCLLPHLPCGSAASHPPSTFNAQKNAAKLPRDIPNSPLNTYRKSGWISMGDWLGTDSIATTKRVFRPFRKARAFVRKLGLRNQKEWRQLCTSNSLPVDIPTNPQRTYEHAGWSGFGDWIGTRNPPRKKKSS
jgi:hypothetical protein